MALGVVQGDHAGRVGLVYVEEAAQMDAANVQATEAKCGVG